MESRCDLFFKDITVELKRIMRENIVGLPSERIDEIAQEWEKHMRREFRGQKIYVPKKEELATRDFQIWQEFRGENRLELCQKYGISEVRLYQIVKAVDARINPKLPFEESENG